MTYNPERMMLEIQAIGARARGDWEAERKALDALHRLDQQDTA